MLSNVKEVECRTEIPVEKCNFTWSIENFSMCYRAVGDVLTSPVFTTGHTFSTTWHLVLYPSGRNNDEFKGKIGVYLTRNTNSSKIHFANFKICFLGRNRERMHCQDFQHLYNLPKAGFGSSNLVDRNLLLSKLRHILLPSDTLTVFCELNVTEVGHELNAEPDVTGPSSCLLKDSISSLDKLSKDLEGLFLDGQQGDLTIKVGAKELLVHKSILCARSPVFARMLELDMKEKLTNHVEISDMDSPVVEQLIGFMYCGRVENLTPEMAVQLYYASERYDLTDLKLACKEFLLSHLSVDIVCDTLLLGNLHYDLDLVEASKNFIFMNAARVQETEAWVRLSIKQPSMFFVLNKEIISGGKLTSKSDAEVKKSLIESEC